MNDQNSFPLSQFFEETNPPAQKIDKQVSTFSQQGDLELFSSEIKNAFKQKLGEQRFTFLQIEQLKLKNMTDVAISFSVPTTFIKRLIEMQSMEIIKETTLHLFGKNFEIDIQVEGSESKEVILPAATPVNKQNRQVKDFSFQLTEMTSTHEETLAQASSTIISNISPSLPGGQSIDKKRIFSNFIVGPSNNLAHAAAVAVAKNPGNIYQSLYIHGNSGLGKTHLLHAIANYVLEQKPTERIFITTATEFMSEMIAAMQEKSIHIFRKKYYELVDILMIDDIHELKNREGTQNEFFHVFNELQRRKKQLVFTSDKDPKEIHGIEDRIRTRLSSALVIEIQLPDLETRIAILKKKAVDKDIYLPDDVVNLIASSIKSNIRELEGSLIKLGAYSSIYKVDIDLDIAKEQLKIDDDEGQKSTTVETVTKAVGQYFKIPIPDIKSKVRNKDITVARHVAMYLSYYIARATLQEIGLFFGKRDHTSIIHAIKKVKQQQKSDPSYSHMIYEIETKL
ncbi:MAG: chromosomal replication initiator protein DnaA [Bacteriovoracaceae bacterium]|nr:chromosomal replication initiator protein DnaA [Bacteriovoracaceae bacterium]